MTGVPFTVTQSHGGPYEDESFISGFYMGTLNTVLCSGQRMPDSFVMPMYSNVVDQADLICMRHGWIAEVLEEQDDWSVVRFRRSTEYAILDE